MSELLKEKLNEISMMLVLTSQDDAAGIRILLDLCNELQGVAVSTEGNERLVKAVEYINLSKDSAKILNILQDFVSTALLFVEGDQEVKFVNENNDAENKTLHPDFAASIDPSFLTEYIETHSPLLEDFEASVIEGQSGKESAEDLGITAKRYIHNLKGDSGSIGLIGIERVCHAVEDALTHTSAYELVPQLLMFKEWVSRCIKKLSEGARPEISADKFLQGLLDSLSTHEEKIPSVVKAQPKVNNDVPVELDCYNITGEKEILVEFANEAEEHLNNVESLILDAEGNYSSDAVDTIFRGVHSIKGGSAYFGLEEMTKCSHILENFLSEVRDGKRTLNSQLTSLLLVYIDLQKNVLLRAKQAALKDGIMLRSQASIDFLNGLEAYKAGKSISNLAEAKVEPQANVISESPLPKDDRGEAEAEPKGDKLSVKTFVKVETGRLDHLIDSIGEMVIYSSMLIRHCRELLGGHEGVMDATHRVEKFSRDLQDIGMSMRLVPIKGLFQKMSRLVWDTSKKLSKDISFSMEGEDTELDRNLIDKLADPLMHMVRNSLDHGIETPEEREKKGKPRSGKVKLSAYHSGGSIHIKIEDDGKGLNTEKLIAKAIEKGIVQEGQKLSEAEAHRLIFAAGFSTASVVTDISGRGVGMDVVRRNVESLRGRIHIESKVDEGSTFTIELPLTLAIIDGIQIQVGKESFLIPSLSIVEFVRPKSEMITSAFDKGETLHFRGRYLPIYRVSTLYNIDARYNSPTEATMVIVENNHEQVALMVDDILGECSTVIKSLGSVFEDGKGIAGCAIMPQGNVALILDIGSLVTLARREYPRLISSNTEASAELVH